MIDALDIHVKGIVQGVGFRPFVYRLAKKYLINGWVLNAADGVLIHAEGESNLVDQFVMELADNPPAAAQVEEVELKEVPLEDFTSFEIRFSDEAAVERTTLVSPDLATCDECVSELFNPNDRRYRYPFINCTNCGPRFTIIDGLPYDRARTSMAAFPMCERCAAEYAEPLDRRFHAQPDACFECGPHVSFAWRSEQGDLQIEWGETREKSDALFAQAVEVLRAGGILAVKGLGGFHLVCDAWNAEAVAELRRRKRREGKAFAVMVASADDARKVCQVSDAEKRVLAGAQRPIVLLRKRADAALAAGLADHLPELGVMLPYTPVQHILLHDFTQACAEGRAADAAGAAHVDGANAASRPPMLVMTSGNVHDEPIVIDDAEAYERLADIADAFLGNDRPIRARYDDSVVRVIDAAGEPAVQFIRRARGYAPAPLSFASAEGCAAASGAAGEAAADAAIVAGSAASAPASCANASVVFAVGPEQKNTFCVARSGEAFVSQHIGDMENAETYDAWLEAKARYEQLFDVASTCVALDMHPEYLSSKWAREQELPLIEVQHHHAHIASVLGEHGLEGPVCGFAFDGTGYGVDGAIWGGEVLLANRQAFERFANFAYVPMPGGAAAVKNPLRMAYGVLWAFDLLEHPVAQRALEQLEGSADVLEQMIEQGINTPYTSSVGRLFDAASALLGVCTQPLYEGEPAILLEAALGEGPREVAAEGSCAGASGTLDAPVAAADDAEAAERYAIGIVKNTATETSTAQDTSVLLFDAAPTFAALLDDLQAGVPTATIARRFHDAFVAAIVQGAELARALYGIETIVLSGGVFMNRYLAEHALAALSAAGFTVALNRDLPPNDGCVSFGQAVVAWAANSE